jgi:hypothetical protein
MKVKRPLSVYLFMGLWLIWAAYKSTVSKTATGQLLWITSDLLVALNLINILRKPNYLELADSKIVINKGYFRTNVIDVHEIEKVVIEPGPFKYSLIILKDKTAIKFNDHYADANELREFMKELQIPVM